MGEGDEEEEEKDWKRRKDEGEKREEEREKNRNFLFLLFSRHWLTNHIPVSTCHLCCLQRMPSNSIHFLCKLERQQRRFNAVLDSARAPPEGKVRATLYSVQCLDQRQRALDPVGLSLLFALAAMRCTPTLSIDQPNRKKKKGD